MAIALLSVSDKSGLFEFASGLHQMGWRLLASGGTANFLRRAGLPVEDVAQLTGSPEILGGRVKTLHPVIHGGILARETEADAADLERIAAQFIDLVVVNLYPFEQVISCSGSTLVQAIENIDIGGVALIRAAAKNFARVTVLTDVLDYPDVLAELRKDGRVSDAARQRLARKAFAHTAAYDTAISRYLGAEQPQAEGQQMLRLELHPIGELRYGENPHQKATLYSYNPETGPLGGNLLRGKALSYNNIMDLDAAWRSVLSFEKPAVCIVKHLSPCGVAASSSLEAAFRSALASDPVSAFGGVLAANRTFDLETANALGDLFVECICAPGFTEEALNVLAARKNLRLLSMPNTSISPDFELRSVNQGVLRQTLDLGDPEDANWRIVTGRQPTEAEWVGLRFAWRACQPVKSNAIVLAAGEATVGIGSGQPNRVDAVRIAVQRAGPRATGAVMASDAFFPFPDSIIEAAKAGVTAVIAPGGSLRDPDAIEAANLASMAMVFTGVRHFRH
jgi:phosphoribosylaminoimidazolecarboxamide formyltransferase/IMP cyclohydrolase